VTLVPDSPDVLTSNSGWDTISNYDFLKDVIKDLSEKNIRTSIFIECDNQKIEFAAKIGADRIELYTENYAKEYQLNRQASVIPYVNASKVAMDNGLGVNAGHDLDLNNLEFFAKSVNGLLEVSIGHALISDAIYMGLENSVQRYLYQLELANKWKSRNS
jgi:pyridoxine 5-phosphate synthase